MLTKRKLFFYLIGLCFAVFATSSTTYAAGCLVKIVSVGTTTSNSVSSGHVIQAKQVTTGSCTWTGNPTNNFLLDTINGDAMLATSLTALSLGQNVKIYTAADTYNDWDVVTQVYVYAP